MKKIIILLLVVTFLISCGSNNKENEVKEEVVVEKPKPDLKPEPKPVEEKKPEVVKEEPKPVKITSVFSGKEVTQQLKDTRPLLVMIDNHPGARQQANLSKASVVYEMRVEGYFTRYAALFERSEENLLLGPIRSARPNFVSLALQHDAIYVHHGGSGDGVSMIARYGLDEVDGMKHQGTLTFRYNNTGKKAPHNSYSETERIYKNFTTNKRNLNRSAKGFLFHEEFKTLDSKTVSSFTIVYSPKSNVSRYEYDNKTKTYSKYRENVLMVDEVTKTPVKPTNIIVQIAKSYVYDSGGHKAFNTIGQGKGYYFTGGEMIEITWSKAKDEKLPTVFKTLDGKELVLNPGQTWIHVVDSSNDIRFN